MAVLQSAALHSIERMTPYNIATTVWALSKLLRTAGNAASNGLSTPTEQRAADRLPSAASGASSASGSTGRMAAASSPRLDLMRPSYPGASVDFASSDSDAGVFSSSEELMNGLPVGRLQQSAAGQRGDYSGPVHMMQLLDELAAATARCAGQFKPAHVGDALWGFGCLRVSPGDAAVSELLSAAAAAPSVQPASAACALVGLAEMTGMRSNEGRPSWMTQHRQTLTSLAMTAGAGFAGLRATSSEQARRQPTPSFCKLPALCPVLLALPCTVLERLTG